MPKLSVVVPAYNEERSLLPCIERVLAIADHDLELEIIIVDDASRDGTANVALGLAARYPEVGTKVRRRHDSPVRNPVRPAGLCRIVQQNQV